MALAIIAVVGVILALSIYLGIYTIPGHRAKGLPPGPPTRPFIGNLHQLPKTRAHLQFAKWAVQYGPIFSLKIGHATTIVLNSPYMIKQLIDKRSSHYGGRPASYIAENLIMHGAHVLFMNSDEKWRRARKLYHQHFMESKCENDHVPLLNAEGIQMLRDIMTDPGNLMYHPKRFSNSIIMSSIFGIRTASVHSHHLVELYKVMEEVSKIFEIGATPPIDIFPILKRLPEAMFGNWRARSITAGDAMNKLYDSLVSHVIQRRLNHGGSKSFLDLVLDQKEGAELTRHELNLLCGTMIEGGSETTSSVILAFVHAMLKHPNVQRQAQNEIDGVIGEDRSPAWADYARLPYVAMTVKETMRWRPPDPLGFPHVLDRDDEIDGFKLPKNSTVIMNVWGLHHDHTRHPNPDIFDPLRYQGRTQLAAEYANSPDFENRDHFVYGAGRRICPGIHLAERSLFVSLAKLLWAFDISPKLDERGIPVRVDASAESGYTDGFVICAKPFQAQLQVRSAARKETILAEFANEAQSVFSQFEQA